MSKKKINETDRIHIHNTEDEVVLFQQEKQKTGFHWNKTAIAVFIYVILFFCSLLFLVEKSAGATWQMSAAYILRIVRMNLSNFFQFIIGNGAPGGIDYQIIRYCIVGLTGAALAACGALLQGTFRNVLAGPSTMGVQSGGMLGNMIYILFFYQMLEGISIVRYSDTVAMHTSFWSRNLQALLVFGGCLGGVFLIMGVATIAGRGKVSSSAMILSGTVLSSVISSFCGVIQYYIMLNNPSDERIDLIRSLAMGSLQNAYLPEHLLAMAAVIIPCLIIMGLFSGKVNALAFGEDAAKTMGIPVRWFKVLLIGISTLMTAIVTAFVGHIGFLGFMVPLIARKICGNDFRSLYPISIFGGAILFTIIYDVARFFGMTDSLNLFTSIIGSVVLLITLLRKRRTAQ